MQATKTRGASEAGRGTKTATCTVCGTAADAATVQRHGELRADACTRCRDTADRVVRGLDEAAARHRETVVGQLGTIVRQVHAGAEFPDYYVGL